VVIRQIPFTSRRSTTSGWPAVVAHLADKPRAAWVLVTGPTGSGKSTTLAAP